MTISQTKTPALARGQAQAPDSVSTRTHFTSDTPLAQLMEPVARHLLGEPNEKLSRKGELRFGTHGSLSVNLEDGCWFDHEQQRGGGVLELIARETGRGDSREQFAWLEEKGFWEKQEPVAKPSHSIVETYDYRDKAGELIFQVVRKAPKDFCQRRPDGKGGWVWSLKGIEARIPYHLDKLHAQPEADVFLVEGEKDVHRLEELGLVATCNAGGAGKWTDHHSRHLAGRRVVILPDNDEPGYAHARKVKVSLAKAGAEVLVVMLPDLPDKGDVSDWLDAGGTLEQLQAWVAQGGHELPDEEPEAELERQEDGNNDKQSQADKIVAFVQAWNDLFHDDNDVAYARSRATGEVRALSSKAFRHWLTAEFYAQYEKAVKDQSLREARMTLEGLAMQAHRPVHIRVAGSCGDYWLDLGVSGSSRCVHLRDGTWSLEDQSDLMFCRSDSAQPLSDPLHGGDIDLLWRIANVPPGARLLVVAWLVECLRPDTPFPVVELLGEHGSAKSTAQAAIRRLIDPNAADLRGVPKSGEDLYVTGGVNHIISIENVSHLAAPIQDAMCVVATGGGFAKRKLYTDSEETVITLKRPVILNGIAAAVTQQDLVSRALTIEMPAIERAQAKDKLEAEFEANRASILGGLLDIAAKALEYLPEMELPPAERPRLIEFAYLGMAVAKAMGEKPEAFIEQFKTARQDGLERTLDASPVAAAIRDWAEVHPGEVRDRSVCDWRHTLESFKPQGTDAWPRSDKGLGDAMRRAAPALRQLGIECQCLGKTGGRVKWRIGNKNSLNLSPECPDVLPSAYPKQDVRTSRTSAREISLEDADREVF